jgi:hypothetical protein
MTASRSIRCDFIMNLDPYMRRAEVGKLGVGATTTTAGGGEDERRAPSLLLPPPPSSAPTVVKSIVRRRTIEGDDRSSSGSSSGANDGVFGAGGANRGKKDGGGPTVIGGGVAGGEGGGRGRRLISREDDPSIRTYPLRVVDQLRLCERKANKGERDDSRIAIATVVGFECIHCRRASSTGGGARQAERFRRFPKTPQEVSIELSSFRTHLSTCRGVPSDLRSYLSWMERRWWPSQRLQRTAPAIAAHIMRRLDAYDCSDETDQNAAPPSANKINESTKRDNDTRKRARELVELERTKLERTKRINVKRRNHSVLEDVGSLA